MSYYPILLELKGERALVIGGGKVAQRKVETLLEFGASIDIVSKVLTSKLKKLLENGTIRLVGEEFREKYLDDVFLVTVATDDRELNHKIGKSARQRGLLVNTIDQPADCNFIVPSIVRRGDLLIAISTSGKSPALAKQIREQLEGQFGGEYDTFLVLMGCLRNEVLTRGLSHEENSQIFHEIVESDLLEAISEDDWEKAGSTLSRILPSNIDIKGILGSLI